jgi:hypothetical protein
MFEKNALSRTFQAFRYCVIILVLGAAVVFAVTNVDSQNATNAKTDLIAVGWVSVPGSEIPGAFSLGVGTLHVIKHVVNDNGGTHVVGDFSVHVKDAGGSDVVDGGIVGMSPDSPLPGVDGVGRTYVLPAGTYVVSENPLTGYSVPPTFTGDCNASGSVTLVAGSVKTCTITSDDIGPRVRVVVNVINNNGGAAISSNFTITATSGAGTPSPNSFTGSSAGTLVSVPVGAYTITGSANSGYLKTSSAECSGLIAVEDAQKYCTITYDDIAPKLTVVKTVVNTGGGTFSASDFPLSVNGRTVLTGVENIYNAGIYTVTETGRAGYTVSFPAKNADGKDNACSAAPPGSAALVLGDRRTCTITNTFSAGPPATLKVIKSVEGGAKGVTDFGINIKNNGLDVIDLNSKTNPQSGSSTGTIYSLPAGTYVVDENPDVNYVKSFPKKNSDSLVTDNACYSAGSVTLVAGETKTCTIKNTYVSAPVLSADPTEITRGGSSTVTVSLPGGVIAPGDVSVDVAFEGTATMGEDYITIPPTSAFPIKIPAGANATTFAILTLDQNAAQPSETVKMSVDRAPGVTTSVTILATGECIGEIMGKTKILDASQVDHGMANFNSHEGARDVNALTGLLGPAAELANLSILGLPNGYAPGRAQAACVASPTAGEYPLKGYVWNDNVGFMSMFCDGTEGSDGNNLGVDCGSYTYGVQVGPSVVPGQKLLSGYAWNPVFGYISFKGSWGGGTYGVIATQRGTGNIWDMTGYAWTQAGVYLKFNGTALEIPSNLNTCAVDDLCCIAPELPICTTCSPADINDSKIPACYCPSHPAAPSCAENYCTENPDALECVTECRVDDADCVGDMDVGELNCFRDFEDGTIDDQECCMYSWYMDAPGCDHEFNWCDFLGESVCVEIGNGSSLINAASLGSLPVADCEDGYEVNLVLKDASGNFRDLAEGETIEMWFAWKDTVRLDQIDGGEVDVSDEETPFDDEKGAGVKYKPMYITDSDLSRKSLGHYKLDTKISSCAPTSGGNVSLVETVEGGLFDNEKFLVPVKEDDNSPVHDLEVAPNNLIFKLATYLITPPPVGEETPLSIPGFVFPPERAENGVGKYLLFRPLVEVAKLATSDFIDAIGGYRDIPINVDVEIKKNSAEEISSPNVGLSLTYKKGEISGCPQSKKLELLPIEAGNTGFTATDPSCSLNNSSTKVCEITRTGDNLEDGVLTITPQLPSGTTSGNPPFGVCTKVPELALYSKVSYTIDGEDVVYYSNKLPRVGGAALDNPAAIIHGTVYSSLNFSPDSSQTNSAVGTTVLNLVRDNIHQKMTKYVKSASGVISMMAGSGPTIAQGDANRCVITGMPLNTGSTVSDLGSCAGNTHKALGIEVGEGVNKEYADYFYGVDVVLGGLGGVDTFGNIGKRVIVVEGGDILIGGNVHDSDSSRKNQLVILAFGVKDGETVKGGNVYIADDVTTLENVVIIADKAVHPFLRMASLPAGGQVFGLLDQATGLLTDGSLDDFYMDADGHKDSSQLFIKGAVSARTVPGISSILDSGNNGLIQHLDGFYETVDTVFKSMFYDWNMFRLYKGGDFVSCSPIPILGLVTDLSCGKCLTISDQVEIANGGVVCNPATAEYSDCETGSGSGCPTGSCVCDGIKATVNTARGGAGDLVRTPAKKSVLAPSTKPFYLYYVPIKSAVLSVNE